MGKFGWVSPSLQTTDSKTQVGITMPTKFIVGLVNPTYQLTNILAPKLVGWVRWKLSNPSYRLLTISLAFTA